MTARAAAVIPARYGASRLPGKLLLEETGKPLLQHTWEAARRARRLEPLLIATDDERIAEAARGFGAEVVWTRSDHVSGSDRVAEVMAGRSEELVLNIQGDEPEIDPADLDRLVQRLGSGELDMVTLVRPFSAAEEATWRDENAVKAVLTSSGRVLYFSRSPVPHDGGPDGAYLHLGVYAWRTEALLRFSQAPPCALERVERLEQLRALELGMRIGALVTHRAGVGIDTPEDYARFVERTRKVQAGGAS